MVVPIPLGDVDRRRLRFPAVTAAIIAVNFLVFLLELANGPDFIRRWALVPAQVTSGHDLVTILTAMFMHASWLHIGGNMIFLWTFGPQIENAMGRGRYLAFYLLGGLVATIVQVSASPFSPVPNLGASGAIAAVMAAFLVTYPRDRIRVLLFVFVFFTVTFIPAVVLVGFWFLMELFGEVGALIHRQVGGVAYMAHVGGFLFGLLSARRFEKLREVPAIAEPSDLPPQPSSF
jgi:membrane associated rhomboid family serine protease